MKWTVLIELHVGNVGWIWTLSSFSGRTPCLIIIYFLESTMSTGEGALGKLGKSCKTGFAPDFGSGCVHRQLCASLSVFVRGPVESRWEPRDLIAPGAATLPHIPSKQCLPAASFRADCFFPFIAIVTTGTILGINGAMELLFKVITPYSKRHVRTVR